MFCPCHKEPGVEVQRDPFLRSISPHQTLSQHCYQFDNVILLGTLTERTHLVQIWNDVALASLSYAMVRCSVVVLRLFNQFSEPLNPVVGAVGALSIVLGDPKLFQH